MTERVRVLIVEDHQVLADGLELTLGVQPDLEVIGQTGSVAEAVRLTVERQPSVVLMDYYLPDGTGAEAAEAIRARAPDTAIVILTAETGEAALLAAVEAGATGFLYKTQAAAQVVEAVRRAAAGEMLIPAATLASLLSRRRRREAQRAELLTQLTAREREVLELMAQGLDNFQIADRLVIGYTTVRGHVRNVLAKLDAHTKLEAVARASQAGLLDR